ncbi:MAG: hypothetical protein ACKVVP_22735 [Chloroflexota bacterium]
MAVPRLLNPFATTRFTLRTSLNAAQCTALLRDKTLGWFQLKGLFGFDATPMSGSVNRAGFRIRRRTPFPRNTYQPIATGTWQESDDGTEIDVRVFEDPMVAWLSLLWLTVAVVVATMFVSTAAAGQLSSEISSVSIPAMLLLPGLGLTAQMYARWMAREESEIMRGFLITLLLASDTSLATVEGQPSETHPARAAVAA